MMKSPFLTAPSAYAGCVCIRLPISMARSTSAETDRTTIVMLRLSVMGAPCLLQVEIVLEEPAGIRGQLALPVGVGLQAAHLLLGHVDHEHGVAVDAHLGGDKQVVGPAAR